MIGQGHTNKEIAGICILPRGLCRNTQQRFSANWVSGRGRKRPRYAEDFFKLALICAACGGQAEASVQPKMTECVSAQPQLIVMPAPAWP
jgi:hypothetical protein